MTKVSVKSRTSEVFVESWVEPIVTDDGHHPDDCEHECPGTSSVQTLKSVVIIQWIEEKLTKATIVHWTTKSVEE